MPYSAEAKRDACFANDARSMRDMSIGDECGRQRKSTFIIAFLPIIKYTIALARVL